MAQLRQGLAKEFGLNSRWGSSEDREEVRRFNKELWKEFRREYFEEHKEEIRERLLREGRDLGSLGPSTFPNEYIPEFIESIESLHFDHGYSLTDIGTDFGFTHERIRQYFEKFGLKRREELGAMNRIWGDKENRFVPIPIEDLEIILIKTQKEKRERKLEKRRERERQRHILTEERENRLILDLFKAKIYKWTIIS